MPDNLRRKALPVVVLLVMLLIAAACGQKPGVANQITPLAGGTLAPGVTPPAGAVGVDAEGNFVDAEGNIVGSGGGGFAVGGDTGGGDTGGG
ncbi:MAG: hypothetical protein M3345_07050, partial [Actinomycetota bacterium]|nr:hypothetical protein [Actinomycetota bacterium]